MQWHTLVDLVNDIIVNRQDNNGNTFGINAGKTKHRGLEATLNISHNLTSKTTLTLIGTGELGDYTFIDFVDNGNDYSGNDLTGIAGDKLNFKIRLDHHSTTFLFTHRFLGSIPLNDSNSGYSDPYHLTGFYFNQDFNLGKLILGISTEVDNIFNKKYASMIAVNARSFGSTLPRYYYPGLPANGKFTLKLKYLLD